MGSVDLVLNFWFSLFSGFAYVVLSFGYVGFVYFHCLVLGDLDKIWEYIPIDLEIFIDLLVPNTKASFFGKSNFYCML